MKKLFSLCLLIFLAACSNNNTNSNENSGTSENDVDAARNFIRSALDGDYSKARTFMLQDSLNNQLIETYEANYQQKMSKDDKRGYREASIRVPDVRKINDSTSIVIYSNSYKNRTDSLKVVRINGQWMVDFKYSFAAINLPKLTIDSTKK